MGKGKAAKKKANPADLLLRVVDLLAQEGRPLEVEVQPLPLKEPVLERQEEAEVLKIPVTPKKALVFTARPAFQAVGLQDIQQLIQAFQRQQDFCWVMDRVGLLIRDLQGVSRFSAFHRLLHERLLELLNLDLVHTFDHLQGRVLRIRRVDSRVPALQELFHRQVGFSTKLAYLEIEHYADHPLVQSVKTRKPRFLSAVKFMDLLPLFSGDLGETLRPALKGYQAFVLPVWDAGGVLGVVFGARRKRLTPRERQFLETLARGLGRMWRYVQVAEQARALQDLLNRIQHLFVRTLQGASREQLLEEAFDLLQELTGAFKLACFLEEGEVFRLVGQRGLSRTFVERFREARPGETPVLLGAQNRQMTVVQQTGELDLSPEDRNEGYLSLVSLPLFEHHTLKGVLTLLFARPWQGTPQVQQILKIVGHFLSIALRRTELEETSRHQLEALRRFAEVLQRLEFPFSPDELVENLVSLLLEMPLYHHVGLWEVDLLRQELQLKTFRGIPVTVRGVTQSLQKGLLGRAARTGETVWANDTSRHPDFVTALPEEWFPYSEICVPLRDFRGQVYGVLQVQSRHRRAFTRYDVHFLEAMAALFSLLYQSFELHQRALLRLQFREFTHRFLEQSQSLDYERLLEEILNTLEELIPEGVQGILVFPEVLQLECRDWPEIPAGHRVDLQEAVTSFSERLEGPTLQEIPASWKVLPVTRAFRLTLPGECPHRYLYLLRLPPTPVALFLLCSPGPLSEEIRAKLTRLAPLAARALYNAHRYERERTARQQREAILEFSPDWILSVDGKGTILYSNYRAFQAVGEPPESLMGRRLQEVVPSLPLENYLKELGERGTLPPTDVAIQASPNEDPYARWNIAGARTPDGQYTLVIRDMSEARKGTADLSLAALSSSITYLAAGVAHEVNNPLTGVIGTLEYWLNRGGLPEELVKDLERARELASQASFIARELLTLTTPEDKKRVKPQPFDLDHAVDQVLKMFRYSLVDLKVDRRQRAERPIYLWGYEGEIQQLLVNLLLNARDAIRMSGKGGRIEVITDVEPGVDGDYALLIVADDGPGIPEEILPRIFAPFFTTKPQGRGTGLGLALSAKIVREHGGTMEVDTEVGKGTRFIVRLPMKPVARPEGPRKDQPSVLIGEFEPFLSRSLLPRLQKEGVYVDVVTDGQDFMEYANSRNYQLIIVNTSLPDFCLDTFYRWLKTHRPELVDRLVILVDEIPRPQVLEGLEEDGVIFLLKPIHLELFLFTVFSRFYIHFLDKRIQAIQEWKARQQQNLQQEEPPHPETSEETSEAS